ncbi:PhzF family phenazine biosynthesis protein [Pseudoalteromonas ruthenica]|uniref:PhzF family phenazine biosynthesis protein n=1 Tax=Pseudoalteromonas ruthenica TaxID=151081 RepID=UPI001485DFCD|nr:PhzF family phenazine biosynthesis protein [Pseudoalteromonas ruthenica]
MQHPKHRLYPAKSKLALRLSKRFGCSALYFAKVFSQLSGRGANPSWVFDGPRLQAHHCRHISMRLAPVMCTFVTNHARSQVIQWWQNGHAVRRCGHGTLAHIACSANGKSMCSKTEPLSGGLAVNAQAMLTFDALEARPCNDNSLSKIVNLPLTYTGSEPFGYDVMQCDSDDLRFLEVDLERLATRRNALIVINKPSHVQRHWQCRYFAPQFGNPEDLATASALAVIAPWLHRHYGLNSAIIHQGSSRLSYKLSGQYVRIFAKVLALRLH